MISERDECEICAAWESDVQLALALTKKKFYEYLRMRYLLQCNWPAFESPRMQHALPLRAKR
jgi:hypothetical protein